MPKIEVNKVAEIMKKEEDISPAVLRRVIEAMNLACQPEDGDEEKLPAVKKQFVILVSDPDGLLPKTDFVGWVLQIPDTESVATTQERINRSAYDFNTTKKGRLLPVKTHGEALENVPAKLFKEADVWVKTKTPVLMLRTDNEIPNTNNTDKLDFGVQSAAKRFVRNIGAGMKDGESMTISTPGEKGFTIDKHGVRKNE